MQAAGLIGGMTLLSRILGMARDMVCAFRFGTNWQWDAFLYAFMIPNFFRRLVAEGALSPAFIPVYTEVLNRNGAEAACRVATLVLSLLSIVFAVFLLLVETGLSLGIQAAGTDSIFGLAMDLMRYFFPFLCFMSLYALGMGILHSHRRFFMASVGPIVLNLFWIAGAFWIVPLAGPEMKNQVRWLAGILLAAGLLEVVLLLPSLKRVGASIRLPVAETWQAVTRMGKLLGPAILGFAIVPLNILVDMTLGIWIGEGANSSLWYGNRLMQLPLGVFAIALGSALLPALSTHTAAGELKDAEKAVRMALKAILFIILPCSLGLILLRDPIVQLLFERGEFDALSSSRTSAVLLCYSLGLVAFSGQKILIVGFYAAQDTRTPARLAAVSFAANIGLNLILMVPLQEAGLALATSLSGIVQFFWLLHRYEKTVLKLDQQDIRRFLKKIAAAAILMSAACLVSWRFVADSRFLAVLVPILISTIVYFSACFILRVSEARDLIRWLTSRGRKINL